jgi:RNA 3'-terminal phosphate cyclase
MGIESDYKVVKHGLFPCIIGLVELQIKSAKNLLPLNLTERGEFKNIEFIISCTQNEAEEFYNT